MVRPFVSGIFGMLLAVSAFAADPTPTAKPPVGYTAQFSTVKTELGHYWITDHDKRVALVFCAKDDAGPFAIGLARRSPDEVLDEQQLQDDPYLDFLKMPGIRLQTDWVSAKAMKGVPGKMKMDLSDPRQVIIHLSWTKSAEEFGTQVLQLSYDQEMARYVIRIEDNLQLNQPGGGEYCNFYPNGVGDFRPWVNRYKQLLFTDGDDGNKLKTHYLSVQKQQPGVIHFPATQALIGYVNEPDRNPVVIIEESTPRSHDNICLSWFDSHLTWDDAGQRGIAAPNLSGPPYRYHAKLKAYWNSPAETRALLEKSQTIPLAQYAEAFQSAVPMDMNVVNDFEHLADYANGDVKHIYLPMSKAMRPEGGIVYDTKGGRSGHSSICFIAKSDKGVSLTPAGPEWDVTPGRQLTVAAWVKTKDVTGDGFYLETGFNHNEKEQLGPKYRSAAITGTHDWTLVQIPLPVTPPQTTYLSRGRVVFHLGGQGTAWVDDLVFAEQDAGAPLVCDPNAPAKK